MGNVKCQTLGNVFPIGQRMGS